MLACSFLLMIIDAKAKSGGAEHQQRQEGWGHF